MEVDLFFLSNVEEKIAGDCAMVGDCGMVRDLSLLSGDWALNSKCALSDGK